MRSVSGTGEPLTAAIMPPETPKPAILVVGLDFQGSCPVFDKRTWAAVIVWEGNLASVTHRRHGQFHTRRILVRELS
ncbi:hypothetical protein [Paenarthrobacter sp. 2TAF44]|uniref:hypothetical protein n=1 Tax=Paenarthrobacter sp. 2TAF44 TaxID=3233018 RepID=UPI003F999FC0